MKFKMSGPREIVSVGNGNPVSHESFQANERKAFNGLCLVAIRSVKHRNGTIELTAESAGLTSSSVSISSD
jgi:beta-galactosidase